MGIQLFEGSDSSSSDAEEISKIEIDQEYARRYEHNKRREDLHRLKELKKRGLVDDSDRDDSEESSESDGDDLEGSDRKDLKFFDALVKVKKMDPILDRKDAKLFDSESEDEEGEEEAEEAKKKKKKDKQPLYLKDVVAKHLIEEGAEFEEKDLGPKVKSYHEEQEEIRRAFLDAANEAFDDDDEDGDLFVEKKKTEEEAGNEVEIERRLDEYFGQDGSLSENEMFLKSFLKNKMWVDKDAAQKPTEDDIQEVLEDEEELEKQEMFELQCQYRHEEGAGDRVLGHARFVGGSVRKKSNARKEQRKRREERKALAEFERKEELKRLKNVKKKEILEKLEKIRTTAGIAEGGTCALDLDDLDEDFNPEEYDQKMKEVFGEGYYDAEDPDPDFGSDNDVGDFEKPNFDKEDELLGLPKDWELCGTSDGFLAAREKILKQKTERNGGEISDDPEQEEEESQDGKRKRKRDDFLAVRAKILKQKGDTPGDEISNELEQEEEEKEEGHKDGKKKKKHKISLQEKVALDKELEEYYKLDYEDTIGDLKTRFKYASVPSNRYGLNAAELLMANDMDLNQYVSLKKLAPYRDTEWKVSKLKRYDQKVKKKLLLQGGKVNDMKVSKKGSSKQGGREEPPVLGSASKEKAHLDDSNGEVGGMSRRRKRRRQQAELKLSQSRLAAYGKIPPKPKIQKKH